MRSQSCRIRRGVSSVELAVLLPFLLFLFVIAVDFGRILYFSQIITDAARDGAIFAMYDDGDPTTDFYVVPGVKPRYATLEEAVLAEAGDMSPQPTVTCVGCNASDPLYDENNNRCVEVTVTWDFNTITHYPGVPTLTTLSRTVRMRKFSPLTP